MLSKSGAEQPPSHSSSDKDPHILTNLTICHDLYTDLASVNVVFGKALLGGIALRADVAAAQLLKRHLVGIDIPAVNADVGGKLLLGVSQFAPKPSRRWLLVQFLHIDWALTSDLYCKVGLEGDGRGETPVMDPTQMTSLLVIESQS